MLLYSNTSPTCSAGTAHACAFMLCLPYHPLSCSSRRLSHRSTLSKYTPPSIFIDRSSTDLIAAVSILTLPWMIRPPPPRLLKWWGEHKHWITGSRRRRICLTTCQTSEPPPPPSPAIIVNNHPMVPECLCWSPLSVKISRGPLGPHRLCLPPKYILPATIVVHSIIRCPTRSHLPSVCDPLVFSVFHTRDLFSYFCWL